MKRSRRNHSSKFKARVATEALQSDATLAELASRHGVHATQMAVWRKQALEHLSEVFENGNPVVGDAERRIRELHAKVGEFTMESDLRCARPAERKAVINRESKVSVMRQCELLGLCRSSLYYRPKPI